jgi:uncharacterized repeat protein (TIGR01451 family)
METSFTALLCVKTAIARLRLFAAFWLMSALFSPVAAQAQFQYTNSVDGPVDEVTTPCTAPLIRTFNVPQSYLIADVNIGVMMSHTYRGDLLMFLTSPGGIRRQFLTPTGGTLNNFNVLLDDGAADLVTSHTANNDTATVTTIVPLYQRNFRPAVNFLPFNGQNANGTWTLEICDNLNQDSGVFFQSDLFITPTPGNLNVSKISQILNDGVSGSNPKAVTGATVQYCITINNVGGSAASNVIATDAIPANMTYTANSMQSRSSCGGAGTAEDDNATGGDETDLIGASFAGSTVTIRHASLPILQSFALTFNATIN